MKRAIFSWISLFFFTFISPAISSQAPLKIESIPRVMEKFFSFHIENKELSPLLVRRAFKIYIEQFDPDQTYFLRSEVASYLEMDDQKISSILHRLQREDYSDFIALNQLAQKATLRAQKMRQSLLPELSSTDFQREDLRGFSRGYSASEEEILHRQKERMIRFYLFHKTRTHLETPVRRAKVYSLFEKKVRRGEYAYLFLQKDGSLLSPEKVEHLMALRILKSFARSLDTHTSFFSPEEAYEMRMSLEKQFEGVGVVLSEGIDGVMVAELLQGSPAHESRQILENDLLVEIDGAPISDVSFEEVLDLLKRKDRGEILLGLRRINAKTQQEEFVRVALQKKPIVMSDERIETSFVRFGHGIIGKISLHSFYESSNGITSEKDIKRAIQSFRQEGELLGLVLDLRNNSGGFLSQAVRVSGLFMANGVVVISKYGQGDTHYLRNVAGRPFFSGPVVVLTSKMSASAAEIVAQALQDYGVALVVGDWRTFGKGSIQYQTVTDIRADLFFKVTVGRYYTVSGKSPQIHGVIADIVVPSLYAPYKIGEKFLEYPLPAHRTEPAYRDTLSDLDEKTQKIFEARYLPFLQREVSFWKRMLPQLKERSAARLQVHPGFQALFQQHAKVRAKKHLLPVNSIDEHAQFRGKEDLQMEEAVHIVEDMLHLERSFKSAK